MTWLFVIGMLKKGWGYVELLLSFLWKYKTIVVISLLLLLTSHLHRVNQDLIGKNIQITNKFETYKKDQKVALLEAQKEAKDKEIQLLNQQNAIEVKYNEKIKNLQVDVVKSNAAVSSLSKQLSDNKTKLSTITPNEISTYTKSLSDVFLDSTTKYRNMAEEADNKRLAEERCVNLYNNLIDNYNKE